MNADVSSVLQYYCNPAMPTFAFAWAGIDGFGAAHLGLLISDYLLHSVRDRLSLEQVEFNTISSSVPLLCIDNFPENGTISGLAEGPTKAHGTYGIQGPLMFPHLHRIQCSHPICYTESTLSVKRLPIDCVRARIYRADRAYHVVPISVNSTVAELRPSFNQKLLPHQERETHKPSLKERGRERVLAPTERPAAIVIRRLQQAGYDQADSLAFLGAEDMTFLMKFVYKSQLLGP
ncbi:hypothetical protein M405DRAFT_886412, partial [Rhizopogon salebrosus TDB-379]